MTEPRYIKDAPLALRAAERDRRRKMEGQVTQWGTDTTPAPIGADALSTVAAFLLGEGALRGVSYGEKPEGERGEFWWRKDLRAALASAAQPTLTVTMRYDLSPAAIEGAIRDKLIEMGWAPPGAAAPNAAPAQPAQQSGDCCNTWFCSLPEGRQAVLREDKWMLAHAAHEAGRASRGQAPAGAPVWQGRWAWVPVEPSTAMLVAGNHGQPGDFSALKVWQDMLDALQRSHDYTRPVDPPAPTAQPAPAPAAVAGPVVAWRVNFSSAQGHWIDGAPSDEMLADFALNAPLASIQYAYAAPTTQAAPQQEPRGSTYTPGDSDIYERWANKDDKAASEPAPAAVAGPNYPSITLDFRQATELLEMFGGEPGLVTLQQGGEMSHSGAGLYAYYSDLPEEGAEFLGAKPDDEAVPVPTAQGDALDEIRKAIRDYHFALDSRRHGGVAADEALRGIERALGMRWQQGAEAAARAAKEGEKT